jgi:chromosome segregation ATPase
MLESTARNPLAAFGDYQQRLSDEVQKASRTFSRKPVGPIGAHVTLRRKEDKKWGAALGEIVGRHLANWIVATPADRSSLLAIARKLRCDARLTIIIQKPRSRHNVRKPPSQTSMLDLLNVDDDACFNALVDMARADVTCVFEDKNEVRSRRFEVSRCLHSIRRCRGSFLFRF